MTSAERSPTLKSRLESCLDFQTHRLAGNLLFDEHGLTPYWGLVNAFEPEHKDEIEPIEVLDDSFVLETSRNWNGKIADPNGRIDNGLYEYKYALWCDRDGQERGADFTLRPGYPNARHVDSCAPARQFMLQRIRGDPPNCRLDVWLRPHKLNYPQVL